MGAHRLSELVESLYSGKILWLKMLFWPFHDKNCKPCLCVIRPSHALNFNEGLCCKSSVLMFDLEVTRNIDRSRDKKYTLLWHIHRWLNSLFWLYPLTPPLWAHKLLLPWSLLHRWVTSYLIILYVIWTRIILFLSLLLAYEVHSIPQVVDISRGTSFALGWLSGGLGIAQGRTFGAPPSV